MEEKEEETIFDFRIISNLILKAAEFCIQALEPFSSLLEMQQVSGNQ